MWCELHPLQHFCHTKVPEKGLQRVLAVEKYHCIAQPQEVLSWARSTCPSAEVVNEAHRVLLQWYGCTTRLQTRQQQGVNQWCNCPLLNLSPSLETGQWFSKIGYAIVTVKQWNLIINTARQDCPKYMPRACESTTGKTGIIWLNCHAMPHKFNSMHVTHGYICTHRLLLK